MDIKQIRVIVHAVMGMFLVMVFGYILIPWSTWYAVVNTLMFGGFSFWLGYRVREILLGFEATAVDNNLKSIAKETN